MLCSNVLKRAVAMSFFSPISSLYPSLYLSLYLSLSISLFSSPLSYIPHSPLSQLSVRFHVVIVICLYACLSFFLSFSLSLLTVGIGMIHSHCSPCLSLRLLKYRCCAWLCFNKDAWAWLAVSWRRWRTQLDASWRKCHVLNIFKMAAYGGVEVDWG